MGSVRPESNMLQHRHEAKYSLTQPFTGQCGCLSRSSTGRRGRPTAQAQKSALLPRFPPLPLRRLLRCRGMQLARHPLLVQGRFSQLAREQRPAVAGGAAMGAPHEPCCVQGLPRRPFQEIVKELPRLCKGQRRLRLRRPVVACRSVTAVGRGVLRRVAPAALGRVWFDLQDAST